MTKLTIDDHLISSLISEIAPLVTSITGWDLQLSTLDRQVVPKEQGYEAILEGRLRALGIPVSTERDFINRMLEYLIENNVMAAYEPLTNRLMVVRENVDDSNLDGLKLILAHELTHRGQHIHHPQLFDRVNRALQAVFQEMNKDQPNLQKMVGYFEEVKPLMTLIESHANYAQGALCQRYFPQAQIERHFTLPVLLFRVLGFGKTTQYTDGLPQVAAAMQQGNADHLFRSLAGV
jgi:hypothetical protein